MATAELARRHSHHPACLVEFRALTAAALLGIRPAIGPCSGRPTNDAAYPGQDSTEATLRSATVKVSPIK